MTDERSSSEQGIGQFLQQSSSSAAPVRASVTPLVAAGASIAAFVAGAAVVALWPSASSKPVAPVSVYSCSEQYTTIAHGLSSLVSEGIEAGQAATPDVSWINSVNERQEEFAAQVEALADECDEDADTL